MNLVETIAIRAFTFLPLRIKVQTTRLTLPIYETKGVEFRIIQKAL